MFTANGINLVPAKNIDHQAWDNCIDKAPNGLPYAYSWYLNIVCNQQWYGIIIGDYQAVAPLAVNRKLFGYRQLFQPILSQQGGLFGEFDTNDLQLFLQTIQQSFRFINISLNAKNYRMLSTTSNWQLQQRMNLILPLTTDYTSISGNYSKSLRKRLRKATLQLKILATEPIESEAGKTVIRPTDQQQLISLLLSTYRQQIGDRISWNDQQFNVATKLINEALNHDKGFIRTVVNEEQELMAIGFFLKSHRRIINLFGASTPVGKATFAMHFMLDSIIQEYANQAIYFDFEGSEIPGVANFFRSFGAEEVPYANFSHDALPVWLKAIQALKHRLTK